VAVADLLLLHLPQLTQMELLEQELEMLGEMVIMALRAEAEVVV
jgi:hypothetical protein